MSVHTTYQSLVRDFESRANPHAARMNRRWFKNEDFVSYGIRTPEFREILAVHREAITSLPRSGKLMLAERLIRSGIQEQASAANWILASAVRDHPAIGRRYLNRFAACFRSWATTDDFCLSVLQPLLVRDSRRVLPLLRQWNRSRNRWKRRASVVTFVRKIGASGRYTDELLRLCENLVSDPDDMVQKGVGWALKDTMRGAPDAVLAYVKQLRRRGAPATITLYALRDLKGAGRHIILERM